MKNLFKVALLAIAIAMPLEDAEACDRCETTKVWVDAYQDSQGALHEGHWKVTKLCHQPPPPVRRPLIVMPPPVIRIGYGHRSHSGHHTSHHRSHSRHHGSHYTSHHRR